MMENAIGNKIEVHLIQHEAGDTKSRMATSLYSLEQEKLVDKWAKEGKYGSAVITRHNQINPIYPSLPSWQIGFEYAFNSNAEFFLWMEDDAFVYDWDCNRWPDLLKNAMIGFYPLQENEPFRYIRNAHYVCTRPFVETFLPVLKEDSLWDIRQTIYLDESKTVLNKNAPRMEPMLTKYADNKYVNLGSGRAARFPKSREGQDAFFSLIKKVCPDEFDLLKIDFPS